MATVITNHPPTYGNPVFDHGIAMGIQWTKTGDPELRIPTAPLVTDFIRDNFLELEKEGYLDEKRLLDLASFLTGWLIGKYVEAQRLPEKAAPEE